MRFLALVIVFLFFMILFSMVVPALFWLIWTKFGIGSLFTFLPLHWQSISFMHFYGIFILATLIRGILFPGYVQKQFEEIKEGFINIKEKS